MNVRTSTVEDLRVELPVPAGTLHTVRGVSIPRVAPLPLVLSINLAGDGLGDVAAPGEQELIVPYESLYAALVWLAPQTPALLALVVGAVVAFKARDSHRQVTRLVMLYVAFEILVKSLVVAMIVWPEVSRLHGYEARTVEPMIGIMQGGINLLHTAAVVAILWAALGWRRAAQRDEPAPGSGTP